ncbi:NAD(P)-dependent dehydrogenase (short-subunit alcohol dehydrogenase family) [Variovorax boronicumulans]|nr:NAD(P)-dependent dehydrogenase (short-subunit alcohol dehydrogenase family) [Variovorax boronicumulans]
MSSEEQKKVAIVTAGGSGMGAAAARKLADDGFLVDIMVALLAKRPVSADVGCKRACRATCWRS